MNAPREIRRVVALAMLVALPAPAASQSSASVVIGAPDAGLPSSEYTSSVYELGLPGGAIFHAVADHHRLPALDGLPSSTLEGIDEARFGFSSMVAYFERLQGPEEERSALTSTATLRLWLAPRKHDRTQRWWRFGPAEPPGGPANASDALWISDEPEDDRFPGERLTGADRIAFVAADREPIIMVQYSAKMFGANSGSRTYHHLLIDFRSGTPGVLGIFDEIERDCGGVCSHYLCMYGVGEAVGCRWEPAAGDFVCAATVHRTDTGWTSRRGSRRFRFPGGARVPWTSAAPPADLDPATAEASIVANPGDRAVVDGIGPLTVIADLPVGSRSVRLLGAPSLAWRFGARLFLAPVAGGRRGPIEEVGSRNALDEAAQPERPGGGVYDPARFTPDGAPPRFAAHVLARSGDLTIIRIAVSEGTGRGVYLVGLEDAAGRTIADAVLVASDGRSYGDCGKWYVPTTAVGMVTRAAPFRVTLDVEHESMVHEDPDVEEEPEIEHCRSSANVEWRAGTGFVVERSLAACRVQPRRVVSIDEAGHVGVAGRGPAGIVEER